MINIEKYNQDDFNATYSPEDNKLRLYAAVRLDKEDWQAMKENGWGWAPKQELFYAYWSVNNEDFCLALAGDIMPEEMTMVERAEVKANRLLILAEKRVDQCLGYQRAANDLMLRLDNNQPILLGHHSQRKAEKTGKQIERTIAKAKETGAAVGYWVWRAQGVVGHANHKNAPRTIYNRIKTLLADMRTAQRTINDAQQTLKVAEKVNSQTNLELKNKNILFLAGDYRHGFNTWSKLDKNEITPDQALEEIMRNCTALINSSKRARRINHILNRLAYEQSQLALVPVYDGALSPAILQTFLRTHGADKPKVTKSDYGWIAESPVDLPLHIGTGQTLELDDQEWRELMQAVGYEVPEKKEAKAPILNFKCDTLTVNKLYDRGVEELKQIELTKEQYSKIREDSRYVRMSSCGTFRFKVGRDPSWEGNWYSAPQVAIFLTDSKIHPVPASKLNSEAA